MAKLVMTIDSDDDNIQKKVKGNKKQTPILPAEEEEILLSANVVLSENKKEFTMGSKQMWKFSESVVLGKHAQSFVDNDDETTNADERAPYKIPIEEKVHL
jgi:hypothetical protein